MAFVVRASVSARPKGLPSWCTSSTSMEGVIELSLMVVCVVTVVLVSVSEFVTWFPMLWSLRVARL